MTTSSARNRTAWRKARYACAVQVAAGLAAIIASAAARSAGKLSTAGRAEGTVPVE
jgi:hypothetical protein